jgi:hypothetical protein
MRVHPWSHSRRPDMLAWPATREMRARECVRASTVHLVAFLCAAFSMQIHVAANDFQSARGSPVSRPPCLRPVSVERAADMFQVLQGGERGSPELQAGTGDGVEAEDEQGSECKDGLSGSAAGESGSRDQLMVEGQRGSWRGEEMTTQIPDWASVLASMEVLGATESACVEAQGHVEGHNLTSSRAGVDAGAQRKGERRWGRRRWAEKELGKGHPAKVSQRTLGESTEFCVSDFARSQMIKMGYDFEKGQGLGRRGQGIRTPIDATVGAQTRRSGLRADGEQKAPKKKELKLLPAKELERQKKHQQEKTYQTNKQRQKTNKNKQNIYQTWRDSQHTEETNAQKRARYLLLLFPDKK